MLPKIVQILVLNTQSLPATEKNYSKDENHSAMQMVLGSVPVIYSLCNLVALKCKVQNQQTVIHCSTCNVLKRV